MSREKRNPAYARLKVVKDLLKDSDSLEVTVALELQVELCSLQMEIRAHESRQKEKFKNSFRTTSEPASKNRYKPELSDLRAFRHFLDSKVARDKYNPRTLSSWLNKINKGELPKIAEKVLKANGYKIIQTRLWAKPNSKKYKDE